MVLNKFLYSKMGVKFEQKYNARAVAEILGNPETYPNGYGIVKECVETAENAGKAWDYNSEFYSVGGANCAGYDETMELYRAFLCAFAKDEKHPWRIGQVSYGVEFFDSPDVCNIFNVKAHLLCSERINLNCFLTEMCSDTFVPAVSNKIDGGKSTAKMYRESYPANNGAVMREIADNLGSVLPNAMSNRFCNEDLETFALVMSDCKIAYACDLYTVRIGKNYLKFYTTERGFDVMSVIRLSILDALTDEQKQTEAGMAIAGCR